MKTALSLTMAVVVIVVAVFMSGCSTSQTAAQTLIALQSATDVYVSFYAPGWANKPQMDAAFTKAIADVEAWKPGSTSSQVVLALNDLAGILDEIPLNGQTDQAIAAGINFITNEVTLIQSESQAASIDQQTEIFIAWINNQAPPPVVRKHVWTGKPVKSPKALKKAWNKSAPKAKLK